MNIDSVIAAYTSIVEDAMPLIEDSLKSISTAEREQGDVLAAIRGGSTTFGSESEVKRSYAARKRDASSRGMGAVEKLRDGMDEVLSDALAFDPADIAAVAPALALKGLSEADLRILAIRNRGSRGALMAIARADGTYAASIETALDGYSAAVAEACRKAGDFSERSLLGQNPVKDGKALRSLIDDQADAMRKAWDRLQAAIDGDVTAGSVKTAMRRVVQRG